LDDEKIIDLFFDRSERALEELARKHGGAVRNVASNFLRDRRDAEECVNDTWLAVWDAIPPQRPNPLLSWLCAVTRNLALKRYHANTAHKRNSFYDTALSELEESVPALETVETAVDARTLAASINAFLADCGEEDRFLFVRRYWFSDSVPYIAATLNCTPHRVSVRLYRLRGKLQAFLEKEGMTV